MPKRRLHFVNARAESASELWERLGVQRSRQQPGADMILQNQLEIVYSHNPVVLLLDPKNP
jgi:hypothetical protein